jgi:hypothetical protein
MNITFFIHSSFSIIHSAKNAGLQPGVFYGSELPLFFVLSNFAGKLAEDILWSYPMRFGASTPF